MYRESIAKDALLGDKELMKIINTEDNLDKILSGMESNYILANNPKDLESDEIVIVLKNAKIIDEIERVVKPKDVIKTSFFAETDLDCVVLKLKCVKKQEIDLK